MREAVLLDWRLLAREARASVGDIALPLIAGVLVCGAMLESSLEAAEVIAVAPQLVRPVTTICAGAGALAAAALTLLIGHPAMVGRLNAHLRLYPVNRRARFAALLVLGLVGRQMVVTGVTLLPFLMLVGTVVSIGPAAHAGVAMLAILLVVPNLVRVACAVIARGRLIWPGTVIAAAAVWLFADRGAAQLMVSLTPAAAVGAAAAGRPWTSVWPLLVFWWVSSAGIDYWLVATSESPARGARDRRVTLESMPWWAHVISRVVRVPGALIHGEMLRLRRWRRFLIGWTFCAVAAGFAISRFDVGSRGTLGVFVVLALPTVVVSSVLANSLAADGAGVQAYFLTGCPLRTVLKAKVCAIGLWVGSAMGGLLAALTAAGATLAAVSVVSGLIAATASFIWVAAVGSIVSVVSPSPTDLQGVGRSLLSAPAALLMLPPNALALIGFARLSFLHDAGRASSTVLLIGALFGLACAFAALVLALRVADVLGSRERLTAVVGGRMATL